MIDYIKILLLEINIPTLLNKLNFKTEVSEKTGELSTKRIAEYHFCKIIIYDSGIALFTGSIHKLWNSLHGVKAPNYKPLTKEQIKKGVKDKYKGFNGNQFTINDILEVRENLQNLFDCEAWQMVFQNIELGVNVPIEYNPKKYLKGLLYHINKMFEYRYKGNLAQALHNRYIFKIYNKSKQYGMSRHTLRFELKVFRTEELKENDVGIATFADINENTLNQAKRLLLDRFDEVMHYDYTIDEKSLTNREKGLINKYSNPRYWIINTDSNHRDRPKKRLQEITQKYSDNLHQKIRSKIIEKCVMINRLSKNTKCVMINSSSIGLNITQRTPNISSINNQSLSVEKKRVCPITGLSLNHEKEGAKYVRTSTIKHLFKNSKSEYFDLCGLLLNNTKGTRPKYESTTFTHLAKQVRNRYYNQFNIKNTGYKKKHYPNQLELKI